MKSYYKIMLGKKSMYAAECLAGGFIGADYGVSNDLSELLTDDWREFNHRLIPIYLAGHPGKSKIAAGLACGSLWTVGKGINRGDVVICPDGHARFMIGEVVGDYTYHPGEILMHRRSVKWYDVRVPRKEVSEALRNSTNSQGTSANITAHAVEIESYIAGIASSQLDIDAVETTAAFVFEKHLEDFLVKNWAQTELGKEYDIYEEDGDLAGQQYPSDTGPIDILAISKDKKTLLVVELKRGRVSDNVLGQIQRYMGYIKDELAEDGQLVKGVIIGLEDDIRIKRALSVTNNIEFYRYQLSFKLFKH